MHPINFENSLERFQKGPDRRVYRLKIADWKRKGKKTRESITILNL